jgi:hypothetical protein
MEAMLLRVQCKVLINWRPRRDLNPRLRRERARQSGSRCICKARVAPQGLVRKHKEQVSVYRPRIASFEAELQEPETNTMRSKLTEGHRAASQGSL